MPSLDRAAIDSDADRVVRKLTRAGYKAYLVGGCVRDLLVGRKPKDFDVATSATPNEVKATFRNSRIIGRRFRLAHVFFDQKIIETATFRANPRDEDEHDLLIRRDNVFGTESEDAKRRDFTINGLFYDVEREEVIDHVGGLADLDAKLVRTIGDPDIRFQEDPVRMLRAIKFAARLDFGFEPATWKALLRWRSEISKCAPPRLLEEMHRLLRGGAARRSFELMVETGVLAVLSPYLAGLLEGPGAPATAPPLVDVVPRSTIARIEYEDDVPDVDDPADEGDADADADEPIDLDTEEKEWHRVWADDPPARPAHASSVKLSFLGGAELAKRRTLVWQALEQLDICVGEDRDPSNAVAFGTLLAPFVHFHNDAEPKGGALVAAVNELSQPLIVQLHVTRRDSERLKYLLIAQRRLASAKKKGVQAELAGGRDLIDDAVLLYTMLERAAGNDAELPVPVAKGGNGSSSAAAEDDDDPNRPRKRRRRRPRWQAPAVRSVKKSGRLSDDLIDDLVDAGSREHYADAALYDYEYRRRRADVTFYRELAKQRGGPILDLGCGSGRVTIPLARDGHTVHGIDQSQSMLGVLAARVAKLAPAAASRISVAEGNLCTFDAPGTYKLALAAFNVLEHLYTRGELAACLARVAAHLAPGGAFAFDVQMPDLAWLIRDPEKRWAKTRFTDPTTKRAMFYSTNHDYDPVGQIANIRIFYDPVDGKGGSRVVKLSQRKYFPAELEALVAHSGFRVVERYGDFAWKPLDAYAESQILICERFDASRRKTR